MSGRQTFRTEQERFWTKVDKGDGSGCWLWTAHIDSDGYGVFYRGRTPWRAHRVAWEFTHGPVPNGMHVLHHCDTRHCMRCLFLGTNADNVADMMAKGRQRRGEAHGSAKLNEGAVLEIRHRYAMGDTSERALATDFGVSRITVRRILGGRTWRHLSATGQTTTP